MNCCQRHLSEPLMIRTVPFHQYLITICTYCGLMWMTDAGDPEHQWRPLLSFYDIVR